MKTQIQSYIDRYLTEHLPAVTHSPVAVRDRRYQLERIIRECRWRTLADLKHESLQAWVAHQKQSGAIGFATINRYVSHAKAFCEWLIDTELLKDNPFRRVRKLPEKQDRRRPRRAYTEDELGRLLHVARWRPLAEWGRKRQPKRKGQIRGPGKSVPIKSIDDLEAAVAVARDRYKDRPGFVAKLEARGRQRALAYLTLAYTGLRHGELRKLNVGQVDLDQACLWLTGDLTKNGEENRLPLHPLLIAELRPWIAKREKASGTNGSTKLFDLPDKPIHIFKRDLAIAGIPKRDARGRQVDVHALRHTFCTQLAKRGVPLQVAQQLMRHSRPELTACIYTDEEQLPTREAVEQLPAFDWAPLAKASPTPPATTAAAAGLESMGLGSIPLEAAALEAIVRRLGEGLTKELAAAIVRELGAVNGQAERRATA